MASGGCICGNLSYSYTGEPAVKALCHCSECKKLTGSVFGYHWLIPRDNLTITKGTPKTYEFTHSAGAKIKLSFCGDCGSTIYKEMDAERERPFFIVQAGTLDDQEPVNDEPNLELWVSKREKWVPVVNGAAQNEEF
ncbi:hypothetical protein QQX98_005717 [Neonectria punicea]|uniref:CENP-V/GFA domain-containing protein n=1 Tax=Neonectria punicea TaxID=979145 RepID=A0ABR1H466_9HYPO